MSIEPDSKGKINVDLLNMVDDDVEGTTKEQQKQLSEDPNIKEIMSRLEETAQNLKKEKKTKGCYICQKLCEKVFRCGNCLKVQYCSKDCQIKNWLDHKSLCKLITPLRGKPGYNDRLVLSPFMQSILYDHGKQYLSSKQPGTVVFTVYPPEKKDFLEAQLRGTKTTASWMMDPTGKYVVHFFILLLKHLQWDMGEGESGFQKYFSDFCANPEIYQYFIPVVEMKQVTDKSGNMEVNSLSYSVLSSNQYH